MVRNDPAIGRRRLRVMLEEPVETPDALGGVLRSFQPRVAVWAALEPVRGEERDEAQQPLSRITHRLSLRWRGDVTAAMRFTAADRVFEVRGQYDPDGMRRTLVCLVAEVRP